MLTELGYEILKQDLKSIKDILQKVLNDKPFFPDSGDYTSYKVKFEVADKMDEQKGYYGKLKIFGSGFPAFIKFNPLELPCEHTVEKINGDSVILATYLLSKADIERLLKSLMYEHRKHFFLKNHFSLMDFSLKKQQFSFNQLKEIIYLIDKLKKEADRLHEIENSLQEKVDADDEHAIKISNEAHQSSHIIFKAVGVELNEIGGFELMQYAISEVPRENHGHATIVVAWNGIGNWEI